MNREPDAEQVAVALQASIGMFLRRVRQVQVTGGLATPERTALARLERCGPSTSATLARLEQISAQSMGATLRALEGRGLVERSPDPDDGRRVLLSISDAGRQVLAQKRDARTEQLARALRAEFTRAELGHLIAAAPLIERLARSL